jgi:hypothetical protein
VPEDVSVGWRGAGLRERSTEWNGDVCVAEAIEVGVASCLDDFSCVTICEGDSVPGLKCVPIRCSGGVEEPVASVADERFDFVDVETVALGSDAEDVAIN